MKRFIKHTLYKKLLLCLAYSLLSTVAMHTTHATQFVPPPISLSKKTLDVLKEYQTYPNWTKPSDGKPLFFHLYEEDQKTLDTLFKNMVGYIFYSDINMSIKKQRKIVFDAIALSINTPYNGESLHIRTIKDKNFDMFIQIARLHCTAFVESLNSLFSSGYSLYLTYLNLSYQDTDGKSLGDYINDISSAPGTRSSKEIQAITIYNQLRQVDSNTFKNKITQLLKNKFNLKKGDSSYTSIMKEAQDIIDSKGLLQKRKKSLGTRSGGMLLKYGCYIGIPTLIVSAGVFFIYKHKASKSRIKEQPSEDKADAKVQDKESKHDFFRLNKK